MGEKYRERELIKRERGFSNKRKYFLSFYEREREREREGDDEEDRESKKKKKKEREKKKREGGDSLKEDG